MQVALIHGKDHWLNEPEWKLGSPEGRIAAVDLSEFDVRLFMLRGGRGSETAAPGVVALVHANDAVDFRAGQLLSLDSVRGAFQRAGLGLLAVVPVTDQTGWHVLRKKRFAFGNSAIGEAPGAPGAGTAPTAAPEVKVYGLSSINAMLRALDAGATPSSESGVMALLANPTQSSAVIAALSILCQGFLAAFAEGHRGIAYGPSVARAHSDPVSGALDRMGWWAFRELHPQGPDFDRLRQQIETVRHPSWWTTALETRPGEIELGRLASDRNVSALLDAIFSVSQEPIEANIVAAALDRLLEEL